MSLFVNRVLSSCCWMFVACSLLPCWGSARLCKHDSVLFSPSHCALSAPIHLLAAHNGATSGHCLGGALHHPCHDWSYGPIYGCNDRRRLYRPIWAAAWLNLAEMAFLAWLSNNWISRSQDWAGNSKGPEYLLKGRLWKIYGGQQLKFSQKGDISFNSNDKVVLMTGIGHLGLKENWTRVRKVNP